MGTVLVTGGAGFIGSHACKALATSGRNVVVYDNMTRGNYPAVQWGDLVAGNLSDSQLLRRTIEKYAVDAVIHFAAYAYVRESMSRSDMYWQNNVQETANLLKVMRETGVKRLVFSSSCASYGVPLGESIGIGDAQNPVNPYGRTKLACEWLIRDYAQQHEWDYALLRYFNVAGSDPDLDIGEVHEPETHIIPILLLKALEENPEPVSIFGSDYPTPDGTCVRDFIHVSDLASVHVKALDHIESKSESIVYNVGLGQGTSLLELLTICEEVTGKPIPHRLEERNPGDPPCLIADPGDVWTTLGLSPRFPHIRTMVEHAWQWMQDKRPLWIKLKRESRRDRTIHSYVKKELEDRQVELSVPGRLCLFGEHSDWAAHHGVYPGHCIVIGTDQRLTANAQVSDCFSVESIVPNSGGRSHAMYRQMTCPWNVDALRSAAEDQSEFFRYCAGVAHEVLQRADIPCGVEVHITGIDLPLKKGVSSSAAVCVLMAKIFNRLFDLNLSRDELMELAYRGERLTGSQCGRMDQACVYGKTPVLLTFKEPESVQAKPVSCEGDVFMFFVDLAGKKDTVRILGDLQTSYPDSPDLQQALGRENEKIVCLAHEALKTGDARTLGLLMNQAQAVFDQLVAPHSVQELKSPILHSLLNYTPVQKYVYGGKGVGSQGDGTAQFVARSDEARDRAMAMIEDAFPRMHCFPLTISGTVRERVNLPDNMSDAATVASEV
ncbi:UDP-glucose 4-epimerase GalE [Planctomycetota bacterium]